jgi:hypothetical protein
VAASAGDISSVRVALSGDAGDLAGEAVAALARGFTVAHAVSLGIMALAVLIAGRLRPSASPAAAATR